MKKILLLSLGAAIALSSCSQTDFVDPSLEEGTLTFTSSIAAAATRVSDTAFDEGDAISVFASDGSSYVAENVKYEYVGDIFISASPIVSDGSSLSFVAMYPYASDGVIEGAFAVAEDQSTEAAYEASDLLSAVTASTTESCPELVFNHSLSAIEINVSANKTISAVVVNAVGEVACNFASSSFVASGSAVAITPLATSEASYSAVVAPQTIAEGSVLLEVTVDGTTVEWNISSAVELLSGYKYICNVTVTDNDVIFEGDIAPWTDGGAIDATIGGGEEDGSITLTLAELSADNIPSEDLWIITDVEAEATDFAGFAAAVTALNDSGRGISVEFPNMTYIPAYIATGTGKYDYVSNYSILSVSAPVATEIGTGALRNCDGLVSANFPLVTIAGNYIFASCLVLEEVNMPLLESAGNYLFQYCKALTAVDLPKLTTAGTDFCNGCSALVSVNMPSLTSTGTNAFNNCDALTGIDLPELVTIGNLSFYDCDALLSLSFPKVTTVGYNAFSLCDLITSIELPSLVTIGAKSLYYCQSLTSFTIGEKVTTMAGGLLAGCDALTNVTCLSPNFVIKDNILYDAGMTTAYSATGLLNVGEVVLPESVTYIEDNAFWYSDKITSFIAQSVTTVGAQVFCASAGVSSVSLPSVTVIGKELFGTKYNAIVTSLKLATSPGAKLESVGSSMFYYTGYTQYCHLTIGSANTEYVSGSTLTVGTESIPFGSITIADDAE